jgi:sec-independent protein translocase protein TatA
MICPFFLPLAMFDIGGQELIFIFFVILLFFGPKKLPELARALAKAKAEFNKASRDFTNEMERAARLPDNPPPPVKKLELPEHTVPVAPEESSDHHSKPAPEASNQILGSDHKD